MANALGTLSSAVIIQRALELVYTRRPMLRAICTDLSDEVVDYGQTINTRLRGIATVNDFGTGATDRADTNVAVTMNRFKEVHHAFTAVELSSTKRDLVTESAQPLAIAIANHMVDAVGALWLAANYTNATTETIANHDYATLTGVRKALSGRGIHEPWHYVANADAYEKFITDPTIIDASKNPGQDVIASANLRGVAGFEGIYEYPAMINTGNLVGVAFHPDAAVLATRVPRNPETILPGAKFPGTLGVVTEPTTGLSVMVNEWIGTDLTANVRLVWMYGVAVGNAAALQRVITA